MVLVKMVNDEAKVKAFMAVSLFMLSMLLVGMFAYNMGYEDGYADADQDWIDYLNQVWGPFVEQVYKEGYDVGYYDGYLWGYVEGWIEYGGEEMFKYPRNPLIP